MRGRGFILRAVVLCAVILPINSYAQWSRSQMAGSANETPYRDLLRIAVRNDKSWARKCAGCHEPGATVTARLKSTPVSRSGGVSCDYCHRIQNVRRKGGRATAYFWQAARVAKDNIIPSGTSRTKRFVIPRGTRTIETRVIYHRFPDWMVRRFGWKTQLSKPRTIAKKKLVL
jgi:hypothetical protein